MAATSKMVMGYDTTKGGKESRSINNCNSEATNEQLLQVANQIAGLQDSSVKTLTSVKRVETVEIM